jgi:glutamate--cysteine ligase
LKQPFPAAAIERFERMAEESLLRQRTIEASDTLPFEEFRQHYLARALHGTSQMRT